VVVAEGSQLAQLAGMTTLSIDTGDLATVAKWASTGLITDATTNPLFGAARGGIRADPWAAFSEAKPTECPQPRSGARTALVNAPGGTRARAS
jgi:transaldolase